MRTRWIGLAGLALLLTGLTLTVAGPRAFPQAYWSRSMTGDMMAGMMTGTMMNAQPPVDSQAPLDQRFLEQMIAHHQQGMLMTQHMATGSVRAELRDLAERIITGQQREIDQMRQWRSAWYGAAPATAPNTMLTQMHDMPMRREQMRDMMGNAVDFDQLFLTMMIPHHEAAVTLAEQVQTDAEHPELKTLAATISSTQRAEIVEMQGDLQGWYGTRR